MEMPHHQASTIWQRGYTVVYAVLVMVFWLVPFFITGWTGQRWKNLPLAMSFEHAAAGLFTRNLTVWWDHHIEGERLDGIRFEMQEHELFPMGAFGYRSKYDRIMNDSARSRRSKQIRLRVAEHIFQRWNELQNGGDKLKAVRLVRSVWKIGSPELSLPVGRWNPPDVSKLPASQRVLLGGYQMVADKVRPFWQEGDPLPKKKIIIPPPVLKPKAPVNRTLVPANSAKE